MRFSALKAHPKWHISSSQAAPPKPTQCYQLGTKCSNMGAYEGPFSFKPPQWEVKATEARSWKRLLTSEPQTGSREQCAERCCPQWTEQVRREKSLYTLKAHAQWHASSNKVLLFKVLWPPWTNYQLELSVKYEVLWRTFLIQITTSSMGEPPFPEPLSECCYFIWWFCVYIHKGVVL